jgi:hypothetical protein
LGIHFGSLVFLGLFALVDLVSGCAGAVPGQSPGDVSGEPAVMKNRKMTPGHNWRKRRFRDVARW